MSRIIINGNELEPAGRQARLFHQAPQTHATEQMSLHAAAADASKSDYVLVQTHGALDLAQKDELQALGLVVHAYVSEDTYLYGYKPSDLENIRRLPFVSYADIYPQYFVVSPDLKQEIVPNPGTSSSTTAAPSDSDPLDVMVVFHRDIDANAEDVLSAVATAAHVDRNSLEVGHGRVSASLNSATYLNDIAAIDAVQLVQRITPNQVHNDVARGILGADTKGTSVKYQGSGQIVAVADTGLDATHPAFAGRIKKLFDIGRPGKTDDPAGHGTHVSGSVLGDGTSTILASLTNGGKIQGIAPKAGLIVQCLSGEETTDQEGKKSRPFKTGNDPAKLFQPAYDLGARIHTNSWGTTWRGHQEVYNGDSRQIDQFVCDHPDMVICFSAGNSGKDSSSVGRVADGQLGEYAGAKNCIAVGASKNLRPDQIPTWGEWWPKDFPKEPISRDQMANNTNGMAAFSSRGPTNIQGPAAQQRIKPDVVSPGTWILSAKSSNAPDEEYWGTTGDKQWAYNGGTSMATPLVAGCAAVVRESLTVNGSPAPTAALVKALIINGADPLLGQYVSPFADPPTIAPNYSSGFGRVNLQQSVIDNVANPGQNASDPRVFAAGLAGFVEGSPLKQGVRKSYQIKVPQASSSGGTKRYTFKVTLVWSDPPGEILQNDLDLIVTAADGTERHGNMGTNRGFDRVNNVEQVVWTDLPSGDVKVLVNAFRILGGPRPRDQEQSYALAWRFF